MVDLIPRELQQNIARIATALDVLAIVAVEDAAAVLKISTGLRLDLHSMLKSNDLVKSRVVDIREKGK